MRRAVGVVWAMPVRLTRSSLLLCCSTFFLGGFCALLAANQLGSATGALSDYVTTLFTAARSGQLAHTGLLELLWNVVRWPLLACLASITAAAIVLLPALLFARGFLLFFAVGTVMRLLPVGGFRAALILFVLTALCTVPPLLTLCCSGMEQGKQRLHDRGARLHVSPQLVLGVSAGMLAGLLCERYLVPVLFSALSHTIGG